MTEDEKLNLVTNYFADDWTIKSAIGLLEDYEKMLEAQYPSPSPQADSQPAPVVGRMSPSKEWLETRLAIADDSGVQAGVPPKNARPCDAPPGCNSHNCLECNDYPRAARAPADSALEDAAPSYTSLQLAEMVLSDCGCSTNNTSLLERVAKRIHVHVVAARKQGTSHD